MECCQVPAYRLDSEANVDQLVMVEKPLAVKDEGGLGHDVVNLGVVVVGKLVPASAHHQCVGAAGGLVGVGLNHDQPLVAGTPPAAAVIILTTEIGKIYSGATIDCHNPGQTVSSARAEDSAANMAACLIAGEKPLPTVCRLIKCQE